MKFGETLSREEVGEWSEFYLDYKRGKKKIEAVQRAVKQLPDLQSANASSLRAIQEVDRCRAEFFAFLDGELRKIDDFYKAREIDAQKRLEIVRLQLEEMAACRREAALPLPGATENGHDQKSPVRQRLTKRLRERTQAAFHTFARRSTWIPSDAERDYATRPERGPPHHVAKRKLKALMQEEYHHVEMLRSFADMNLKAFEKITKKYAKETRVPSSAERNAFMDSKVNKARFVESDEIKALFDEYERLYAEYFEKNNHKAAASKLRAQAVKPMQYLAPGARASFACGAGLALGIQGLYAGVRDLYGPEPYAGEAAYLLQLYGGFFLILEMAALFVAACAVFRRYRVNWGFIFALDPKSALNWCQMAELAAWPLFWTGLVVGLNFTWRAGGEGMYTLWPVVLVCGSVVMLALPVPFFYHKARKWLFITLCRQVVPFAITVEFRDFFGGDILCSLTYALGNLYLFGCIYAREWASPARCGSSQFWGMGVLTCIPAVIRAIQCVRRWYEERAVFPHMANFAKYCLTIGQYAFLQVYRLNVTKDWALALFAVVASITSIYCMIWDIQYDWSLGNTAAKRWGLRDTLVFRKHTWVYYAAIVVDVLLRLNWIPYCIWTKDAQHASIVSFVVALTEVLRRGMWAIFRIENEQATRIERRQTLKGMDLPYGYPIPAVDGQADGSAVGGETEMESQRSGFAPSALSRLGVKMRTWHTHDYATRPDSAREEDSDDDDDDDE